MPLNKITSKNVDDIFFAIFLVILKLQATTPPNALTGSQLNESSNVLIGDPLVDAPEGFACLIITVPGFLKDPKISNPVNISL